MNDACQDQNGKISDTQGHVLDLRSAGEPHFVNVDSQNEALGIWHATKNNLRVLNRLRG